MNFKQTELHEYIEVPEAKLNKEQKETPETPKFDKMDEQILVFDKSAFSDIYKDIPEDGVFNLNNDPYVDAELRDFLNRLWETYGGVARRGDVEEDAELKQPIPYTILVQDSKIFTYTRLEGGGEERLHGKSSIGVGGHMNNVETPFNFEHIFAVNNARELYEEVSIKNKNGVELPFHTVYKMAKETEILGLIYNEKTPVDSVHMGILNMIYIPSDYSVTAKETDTLEGRFLDRKEIKELNLENWTKSALTVL